VLDGAENFTCRSRPKCSQRKARPFGRLEKDPKRFMSQAMMFYGRPIRNPRLFLVSALLAAGLMLPLLGAIA
jgi:hypothetical protein